MSDLFQGFDNRWLVVVSSPEAAKHLVRDGFHMYSRHVAVRHYDDVLAEEYKQYQEYVNYQEQLNTVRQKMMNIALGDTIDYEKLKKMAEERNLLQE